MSERASDISEGAGIILNDSPPAIASSGAARSLVINCTEPLVGRIPLPRQRVISMGIRHTNTLTKPLKACGRVTVGYIFGLKCSVYCSNLLFNNIGIAALISCKRRVARSLFQEQSCFGSDFFYTRVIRRNKRRGKLRQNIMPLPVVIRKQGDVAVALVQLFAAAKHLNVNAAV